jgi:CheY-like chemotaxis protein
MVDPLTRAGYRVEVRNDGESGLRAFHELSPSLVLIEPMIPKKHGFQVCRAIKDSERGRDVPVVIATSFYRGRKHSLDARKNYRCDDYLEKPVAEAVLLERCRALISVPVAVAADGGRSRPSSRSVATDEEGTSEGLRLGQRRTPGDDAVASEPTGIDRPARGGLANLSDAEIEASLDGLLAGDASPPSGPEAAMPLIDLPLDAPAPPEIDVPHPPDPEPESLPRDRVEDPRQAVDDGEGSPDVDALEPVAPAHSRRSRAPLWIALAAIVCIVGGVAILWWIGELRSTPPSAGQVERPIGDGEGVVP